MTWTRDSRRIISWTCPILLLGASFFHLLTLGSPTSDVDDFVLVDIAVHGRLSLWEHILPPTQKHFINAYGIFLNDFYNALRWFFTHFGVGLVQARCMTLVPALAGMGFILWILLRIGYRSWELIPVTSILFTALFFHVTHKVRTEGILFLIMQLNFAWLLLGGGRFYGLLAGLLAGASLAVHPSIVFLWTAWPLAVLMKEGKLAFKNTRYLWWFVGGGIGLLHPLFSVDMDQAMQYFALAKFAGVQSPPLMHWKFNVWQIFYEEYRFIVLRVDPQNPWHVLLWALVLSASAWTWRRWKTLSEKDRWVVALATALFISKAALSGSVNQICYELYALPWMFLLLGITFTHLMQGRMKLDWTDQLIFVFFNVLGISFLLELSAYLILLSLLIRLMLGAMQQRPSRMNIGLVFFILFSAIVNIEFLQIVMSGAAYSFRYRPFAAWFWMIMPWILFEANSNKLEFRKFARAEPHLVYIALLFCLYMGRDGQWIHSAVQKKQSDPQWQNYLSTLQKEPRLVGPPALWVNFPTISMQSIDALTLAKVRLPRFNIPRALMGYHPSLVLWPVDDQRALEQAFAGLPGPSVHRIWGSVWKTPFGDFQELRLTGTSLFDVSPKN